MKLLVSHKAQIARDIFLFELRDPNGAALPSFGAGAHLEITGPTGLVRKYSICSAPDDSKFYRLAIKRELTGRGGSNAMVSAVFPGDKLEVSLPRNDFPLTDSAGKLIFIAGGIGITPILSMMQHADRANTPYELYYLTRSFSATAFLEETTRSRPGCKTVVHHDDGDPDRAYDLTAVLSDWLPGTHLYCCGPRGLMDGVRNAAAHWPQGAVHFEDFGAASGFAESCSNRPFQCHLAKSGVTLDIPADKSIVQVLRESGVEIPTSCETGSCGTCKTALLAGIADHRDLALFDDELDSFIIPCVSRATTPEITIDR